MAIDPYHIKLTKEQLAILSRLAAGTGKSQEEILSDALVQYYPKVINNTENDKSLETLYDILSRKSLIGCLKGGTSDLSTNPKYMKGFGESDQ